MTMFLPLSTFHLLQVGLFVSRLGDGRGEKLELRYEAFIRKYLGLAPMEGRKRSRIGLGRS